MNTNICTDIYTDIRKKIYDIHNQIFHSDYNKISISFYELNKELTWAFDPVYGIPGTDLYIYNKLVKRIPSDQLKDYIPDKDELLIIYHYMTTEDNATSITFANGLSSINNGNYKSILITAHFLDMPTVINIARDEVLNYIYDVQKAGHYHI